LLPAFYVSVACFNLSTQLRKPLLAPAVKGLADRLGHSPGSFSRPANLFSNRSCGPSLVQFPREVSISCAK